MIFSRYAALYASNRPDSTYLRRAHRVGLHQQRAQADRRALRHEILRVVHRFQQRVAELRVGGARIDDSRDERGGVADVGVVGLQEQLRGGQERGGAVDEEEAERDDRVAPHALRDIAGDHVEQPSDEASRLQPT